MTLEIHAAPHINFGTQINLLSSKQHNFQQQSSIGHGGVYIANSCGIPLCDLGTQTHP